MNTRSRRRRRHPHSHPPSHRSPSVARLPFYEPQKIRHHVGHNAKLTKHVHVLPHIDKRLTYSCVIECADRGILKQIQYEALLCTRCECASPHTMRVNVCAYVCNVYVYASHAHAAHEHATPVVHQMGRAPQYGRASLPATAPGGTAEGKQRSPQIIFYYYFCLFYLHESFLSHTVKPWHDSAPCPPRSLDVDALLSYVPF